MKLSPVTRQFVLHWGEMGTRWGINRTVAQIHALLYVSPKPLTAEEIAATLTVARSNVSNSLRELQNWGIVHVVHVMGDRRDHFESLTDVWQMFQIILAERKRREVDPTLAVLRQCVSAARASGQESEHLARRLRDLLDFFETMSAGYEQVKNLPPGAAARFTKLGSRLSKLLGLGP